MPTKRGIRVVLLVEDEALECFVRRVLLDLSFQTRDIRVKRSPKGRGSGKDWVTKNYPDEVRAHRAKASYQENIGIVVGIDADEETVQERGRALDAVLERSGLEKRRSEEKFCLIIPKWNIESWLVYLGGEAIDEDKDDYKNHPSIRNVDYPTMADAFVERYRSWRQGSVDQTTPPSMIAAFEEIKRFGL
jgi:hypothetical protein